MYVSRGVLVLMADLKALERPLKLRNFLVIILSANPTDQEIADLLTHRVLITENSKDFLEPAVIHEFSVIDTEHPTRDPEKLAGIISKEWLAGSGPSVVQVGVHLFMSNGEAGDPMLRMPENLKNCFQDRFFVLLVLVSSSIQMVMW